MTTTIDFIKKHTPNQTALAKMLNMSNQSFNNKLHGNGKSKPFTSEEINALNQFILSIGDDVKTVRQSMLARLRGDIAAIQNDNDDEA